jgi:hypothetical protein
MTITRVKGSDIGILAYRTEGYEEHGLVFLGERDRDVCGAQCVNCSSIIWTNSRRNSILNEEVPDDIPDSGLKYRNYFMEKIQRFLVSLPECPKCREKNYDILITGMFLQPHNLIFPRFEDGTPYPFDKSCYHDNFLNDDTMPEDILVDSGNIMVWWYEEEVEGN